MPTNDPNIVLGSGKLYLAEYDSNGNRQGFQLIGETPGFTIQVTSEKVTIYSSDSKTREKLVDKTIEVTRNGTMTARDVTDYLLKLFLGGEISTITQTSQAGQTFDLAGVEQGKWYLIGDGTEVTGVRDISNVTVTGDGGTPSYAVDTDYELDLVRGRIYIVEGGSISDGDDLDIEYDVAANTRTQVKTNDTVSIKCALHYIADNSEGDNRDVLMPWIELSPDGEVGWKDVENAQEFGFSFDALVKDTSTSAIYVDGQAA